MRTRHSSHPLPAFPVYSSAFLSENELLLGGGGGASRTGIKNRLRLYKVDLTRSFTQLDEFELDKDEDAPMSMAAHGESRTVACGVNSALEKLEKGQNENCRVFSVKDDKLELSKTRQTLSGDLDDYQKVTALSPDGTLLAVAGAHSLFLLSYPLLESISEPIQTEKEIYDITFSPTTLVVVTTHELLVFSLPNGEAQTPSPNTKRKAKAKKATATSQKEVTPKLELLNTLKVPELIGVSASGSFRSARYHPDDSSTLYSVINSSSPRTKKTRTLQHQAFVCKWNTRSWTIDKIRKVGDRGLTCFDISADGRYLGFGSSDMTIGLLDANSLVPLVSILKAHEFPPTTIAFNTTSSIMISGSADSSIRIVDVPQSTAGGPSWTVILLIAITVLALVLAFVAQRYFGTQ